jgi:hypothetical protein
VRTDVRDQDARRRGCDSGDVVVLGVPDARVAEAFRQLGDRNAALKTVARGFAGIVWLVSENDCTAGSIGLSAAYPE